MCIAPLGYGKATVINSFSLSFGLDSNNFSTEQQLWFESDLKESDSEDILWKIVMVHSGPYTTGDHGFVCSEEYIKKFSEICSRYKVDLVLQAHDHVFSKTHPYYWETKGYYFENAEGVINFAPEQINIDGIEYDYRPNGTYYVSSGSAGHRVGENIKFASCQGENSYTNRNIKIAIGEIEVNSVYASIGEHSSADLSRQMCGLLYIEGNILIYSFYVINENGDAILYDRLAIAK